LQSWSAPHGAPAGPGGAHVPITAPVTEASVAASLAELQTRPVRQSPSAPHTVPDGPGGAQVPVPALQDRPGLHSFKYASHAAPEPPYAIVSHVYVMPASPTDRAQSVPGAQAPVTLQGPATDEQVPHAGVPPSAVDEPALHRYVWHC